MTHKNIQAERDYINQIINEKVKQIEATIADALNSIREDLVEIKEKINKENK